MGATNKPTRDGNSLKENAEIDDNYDSEEDAKADNIGCQEIRDEVENDDYIEEGIIQQEELLTVVYEVLDIYLCTPPCFLDIYHDPLLYFRYLPPYPSLSRLLLLRRNVESST